MEEASLQMDGDDGGASDQRSIHTKVGEDPISGNPFLRQQSLSDTSTFPHRQTLARDRTHRPGPTFLLRLFRYLFCFGFAPPLRDKDPKANHCVCLAKQSPFSRTSSHRWPLFLPIHYPSPFFPLRVAPLFASRRRMVRDFFS